MFYFSVIWYQLIISYIRFYLFMLLLILNSYKYSTIPHLHALITNLICFFLTFSPLTKKKCNLPLINIHSSLFFLCVARRNKNSGLCIQWHLYKGWFNGCFSSSVCLAGQNRLSKTVEAQSELIWPVPGLPFICIHKTCQLRLN